MKDLWAPLLIVVGLCAAAAAVHAQTSEAALEALLAEAKILCEASQQCRVIDDGTNIAIARITCPPAGVSDTSRVKLEALKANTTKTVDEVLAE